MNKSIFAAVIVALAATPALAQKPDTTDKGKPSQEQMEAHHEMMESNHEMMETNSDEKKAMMEEHRKMAAMKHTEAEAHGQHAGMVEADAEDKMMKEDKMRMKEEKMRMKDEHKGMEKQREKKADQEQKELDKGSEQGQAAREEHSKKWWQFWKS